MKTMHKTLMGAAIAGTMLISGTAAAQQMQERGDQTVAAKTDSDQPVSDTWITTKVKADLLASIAGSYGDPAEVADVDREPHAILQAGALRLGDQPDVEEGLADAGLVALNQLVGRGVDALHAGDEDEVAGPRAEAPGPLRLDGARRIKRAHAIRRLCDGSEGRHGYHDKDGERPHALCGSARNGHCALSTLV